MKEVVGKVYGPIYFSPFIGPMFGLMETFRGMLSLFSLAPALWLTVQGTSLYNSASV